MTANGMSMEVTRVDFEVKPIEAESLDESKDSFTEEAVDAIGCSILEEKSDHRVTKDKSYKRVSPFRLVFDVDSREKVEPLGILGCEPWMLFLCPSFHPNKTHYAKEIDDDRNPD